MIAGALAWGFLGFGALVITAVSIILFTGQSYSNPAAASYFKSLTGFGGYIAKIRLFSRNARLFMVHVVGMDVIYGTWTVLFNLYLLAVGFDIMAGCILVSNLMFWQFFAGQEEKLAAVIPTLSGAEVAIAGD